MLISEAIVIPIDVHKSLKQALDSWVNQIKLNRDVYFRKINFTYTKDDIYDDESLYSKKFFNYLRNNQDKFAQSLKVKLYPIINPFLTSKFESKKPVVLEIKIEPPGLYGGQVFTYKKAPNTIHMRIYVSNRSIWWALRGEHQKNAYVKDWLEVIEHELTHAIQYTKNKLQVKKVKPYTSINHPDLKSFSDFINKLELDAYAAGVASIILSEALSSDEPAWYIWMQLRYLSDDMFHGKNINQKFRNMREFLKAKSSNPVVNHIKEKAWRRFIKKITERLTVYLDELR